tara:strand:+ start:565 stop:1089 length:525 start_codon:yes stop_codon:yes gene_type:complete
MEKDGEFRYGPLVMDVDELILVARRLSEVGEWRIHHFDGCFDSLDALLTLHPVPIGRVQFVSEAIDVTLSSKGGNVYYSAAGAEKAKEIERLLAQYVVPPLFRYRIVFNLLLLVVALAGMILGYFLVVMVCIPVFFILDGLASSTPCWSPPSVTFSFFLRALRVLRGRNGSIAP